MRTLPGVVAFGETREAAVRHAGDAIEISSASLIADGLAVPHPKIPTRLKRNGAFVALSALATLKVELYWAMRDAGITRAELMQRLNSNRESVADGGLRHAGSAIAPIRRA